MKSAGLISMVVGGLLIGGSAYGVRSEVRAASKRLEKGITAEATAPKAAVANDAEAKYCTPEFKNVLARVIHACGLGGQGGRRGCQPADVKSLASISDDEFNALFTPLKERAAVVMFEDGSDALDQAGKDLIEERWLERKGARYFFVVARASPTGSVDLNRKLSHKRANSVLFHVQDRFNDPDLDQKVGLLWLGKEFAQLGKEYCEWTVSRPKGCAPDAINRSAFVSWVDCQL
jgi:outer membrane protein OmpA-like peptidoglycan-associated protein